MLLEELNSSWFWALVVTWHLGSRCGITSVTVEFTMVGSSISGSWWCLEPEQSLHVSTRKCSGSPSSCNLRSKQVPCTCMHRNNISTYFKLPLTSYNYTYLWKERNWESLMMKLWYHTWNVSWALGSPDVVKVTEDVIVFATIMSVSV